MTVIYLLGRRGGEQAKKSILHAMHILFFYAKPGWLNAFHQSIDNTGAYRQVEDLPINLIR